MSHYRHATATSEALAAAIEELQSALREAAGPPQIMPTRRGRVAQLRERLSEDEERAFYTLAVLFDPGLPRNVVDRIWDR